MREFVSESGVLPLPGIVPDMKADTENFVGLQLAYQTKAKQDFANVQERALRLWQDCRKNVILDNEEIERFCKNTATLKVKRYRSLLEEQADSNRIGNALLLMKNQTSTLKKAMKIFTITLYLTRWMNLPPPKVVIPVFLIIINM